MLKDLASGLNGGPSVGLQKGHGFHRTTALSTGLPCGGLLPTQAWGIVPPPAGVPVEHHLGPICLLGPLSLWPYLSLQVRPGAPGPPHPKVLGSGRTGSQSPAESRGSTCRSPPACKGRCRGNQEGNRRGLPCRWMTTGCSHEDLGFGFILPLTLLVGLSNGTTRWKAIWTQAPWC